MLEAAPLLGHGYHRFPMVYERHGEYGQEKGAHVGYAEYAAELGLIGLALYVGVMVALGLLGRSLRRRGSTPFDRAHGAALIAAALALMVSECFGSRFKIGPVMTFLYLYAGVAAAALRWPESSSSPEGKKANEHG
jgi:O-antigen ligase